ncbi:MAG: DUF4445 domain-containing protein [Lachnospiraceae bacterium]|nr:DUF4445 domain-containing protein [Lachnospiraceae bacterium]
MNKSCAIAIDIGTTNIEAKLTDDASYIMSTTLQSNVNTKFGRDVMTRITQAERGNLHQMSIDLRQQLFGMISELTKEVDINRITIACNTTITHILLEEDCHNLGVYPFSPVRIEQVDIMSTDIDIYDKPVPVTVLPGFSAYIGGDIMAGVISLDLMHRQGRSLLIDLGTNGEMVYHDPDAGKMLVTSAAAGPAFELAGRAKATEIIEGIAALRQQGIIDETGLLTDEYFDTGYRYKEVNITQNLIRDVQTAKSAIRSGIEILLSKAGTDIPDNIFIAGAFGDNLDIDAAIAIGMFPEGFKDRITLCGNTSLSGAIRYSAGDKMPDIPAFEEIYLAKEDTFNDLYISHMDL